MTVNKWNRSLKNRYIKYLLGKGFSNNTIRKYSDTIDKFIKILDDNSILLSTNEDIILFRDAICKLNDKNGIRYSVTSIKLYLNFAKRFLSWLASQKGFKYIAKTNFLEILNLTKKLKVEYRSYVSEKNKPISEKNFYKLYNSIEKNQLTLRTKCMLVTLAYCAPRNGALRTLRIGDIHIEGEIIRIIQNPRTCDTKFGKNIQSFLILPIDTMYNDFIEYLTQLKNAGFTKNDPLFGKLKPIKDDEGNFNSDLSEITNEFYKSNSGINNIIKNLCKEAELEDYYTVHSFRHYYALYIKPYIKSASELESVASSLGHKSVDLLLGRPYGKQTPELNFENMINIQKRIRQQYSENKINVISQIDQLAEKVSNQMIKALSHLSDNNKLMEGEVWN